jgi:hypothetical protein
MIRAHRTQIRVARRLIVHRAIAIGLRVARRRAVARWRAVAGRRSVAGRGRGFPGWRGWRGRRFDCGWRRGRRNGCWRGCRSSGRRSRRLDLLPESRSVNAKHGQRRGRSDGDSPQHLVRADWFHCMLLEVPTSILAPYKIGARAREVQISVTRPRFREVQWERLCRARAPQDYFLRCATLLA